ncbi:hypothetical protein [Bradyrhizobium sp. 27S5]
MAAVTAKLSAVRNFADAALGPPLLAVGMGLQNSAAIRFDGG